MLAQPAAKCLPRAEEEKLVSRCAVLIKVAQSKAPELLADTTHWFYIAVDTYQQQDADEISFNQNDELLVHRQDDDGTGLACGPCTAPAPRLHLRLCFVDRAPLPRGARVRAGPPPVSRRRCCGYCAAERTGCCCSAGWWLASRITDGALGYVPATFCKSAATFWEENAGNSELLRRMPRFDKVVVVVVV